MEEASCQSRLFTSDRNRTSLLIGKARSKEYDNKKFLQHGKLK